MRVLWCQAIWAKGYTELLDLMDKHKRRGEAPLDIDCYGSGEDLDAVCSHPLSCLGKQIQLHLLTPAVESFRYCGTA